ncbi:MAG: trimeric intracellular cation channel family protein [Firmicutes bacterium]|nr:trimeric intracellular cation channel family protein [Bacillota bacterium]
MFFDIITVLQIAGIIVAAISGVMVAGERHLDLFGALVLGCVTAIGGGIMRDILLGITPPQMFRTPGYVLLALVVSMITAAILYHNKRMYLRNSRQLAAEAAAAAGSGGAAEDIQGGTDTGAAAAPEPDIPPVYDFILNAADSMGLAVFAISGVQTVFKCGYEHSFCLAMFIGLITAVGGGVLRDILAGKTPVILRKRIYALAALAGCLLYYLCFNMAGMGVIISSVISIVFMVIIRSLSYIFKWNMPSL